MASCSRTALCAPSQPMTQSASISSIRPPLRSCAETPAALRQSDQLRVALDRNPQFRDALPEKPLGLVLRNSQNTGIARVEPAEFGMGDRTVVAIEIYAGNVLAHGEEIICEPHEFEALHRPRMDCDRSGFHCAV